MLPFSTPTTLRSVPSFPRLPRLQLVHVHRSRNAVSISWPFSGSQPFCTTSTCHQQSLSPLLVPHLQLEHVHRSREATLDKLKGALADKVDKEEKRLARDKAAYAR